MTTTPTASPELLDLDKLEALARAATPGRWMRLWDERTVYDRMEDGCRGNAIVRGDLGYSSQDANNLDFIAAANPAAVLALIALARRAKPEGEAPQAVDTPESMAQSNARFAIDGAIQYGRENRNEPPSTEHWLYEYWNIGRQLAQFGATGWDNVTPAPAATFSPLCGAQQNVELVVARLEQIVEGCDNASERAEEALICMRAALGAQQATVPGNSPEIPDSSTSAPGTPEAPTVDGDGEALRLAVKQGIKCKYNAGLGQGLAWDIYGNEFIVNIEDCNRDPVAALRTAIQRAAQLDGGQEGSESNG